MYIGKREDALHCARLAVATAHERLDVQNKTKQIYALQKQLSRDGSAIFKEASIQSVSGNDNDMNSIELGLKYFSIYLC